MNRKKWLTFASILLVVLLLIIVFVPIYNHCICPFEGYNKDMIYNCNNYEIYDKNTFEHFFVDYVKAKEYEQDYQTDFYYKHGKRSLCRMITYIQYHYALESYSYIIRAGNEYQSLKSEIINRTSFLPTPIGDENITYVDTIDVNGTIFSEIYFRTDDIMPDEVYKDNIRDCSFWFAYNDEKQELIFSYLYIESAIDYFPDVDTIKEYLTVNLYV